jgi:multisubunit Na+/H+ antiporter MnhB subunit
MVQGIMAGWIFILIMAALYTDENLRHLIPAVLGAILAVVVVTIPIWLPIVESNYHKWEKKKKQMVEIEGVE